MKITENFTLEELLHSDTATKYGYTEQFNPPQSVIDNLTALAVNILQPLRDNWTKDLAWKNSYGETIEDSCAYRCERVNTKVGGAMNSQHLCKGQDAAADITAGSRQENKILFEQIQKLKLPFDQLICEGGKDINGNLKYSWIHVSFNPSKNRRQILYL